MKKMIMPVMMLALMGIGSAAIAQNKQAGKAEKKEVAKKEAVAEKKGAGAAELKKQATAAPAAAAKKVEDKIVKGKKGPEGQTVYEGAQGGKYYINKNGNKTYLKN